MYALFVSRNAGMSYSKEREAETLEELKPHMDELDEQMLRWYLEKDGQDCNEAVCAIHVGILSFMVAIRDGENAPAPARADTAQGE